MWTIYERQGLERKLRRLPKEIKQRYEKWKDIVRLSGPKGLRMIKGFHDEKLRGGLEGFRSSRWNEQYRVIYRVERNELYVEVVKVNAHDYRR